jgi:hypothetical protein
VRKLFSLAAGLILVAGTSAQAHHPYCGYAAPSAAFAVPAAPPVIAYGSGTAFYMGFAPAMPYYAPAPFFGSIPTYAGYPPAYFNGRPFISYPAAGGYGRW